MLKREETKDLLNFALKNISADEVEVGITADNFCTTRFANSIIHQNIAVQKPFFWVRLILNRRVGSSITNDIQKEGIKNALKRAKELALAAEIDKELPTLPKPKKSLKKISPPIFITPKERAKAVETIVKTCQKYKLNAFGVIHTVQDSLGILSSRGADCYGNLNWTYVSIIAMSDSSSGFAYAIEKDFYKIDFKELTEVACEKALRSFEPKEIEVGKYTVFLEEACVAEMLAFLAWLEFGAKRFYEKTSIISKKIGKKVTGDMITLYDDYAYPKTLGLPFDFEGVPKEKVVLIKNGVAKGVVTDSFYAKKLGKRNTGHALLQPSPWGPFPLNLVMEKGDIKKEKMIEQIEEGIYVTRFWYTRVVNPDKTLITGMTRDGTYFIKNGKIAYPVKNMRFQINIYETLSNVRLISKEERYYGEEGIGVVAPSLVIDNFSFIGKTEY